MRHHPTLYTSGRHGCWATCACGWTSERYTTSTGAHIAFGAHLTTVNRAEAAVEAPLAASGLPDDQRRHPQGQQDVSEENR